MKVNEAFPDDPEAYAVLLEEAAANLSGDWEQDFVGGLRTRYEKWGAEAYVSDKQLQILRRIASGDEK